MSCYALHCQCYITGAGAGTRRQGTGWLGFQSTKADDKNKFSTGLYAAFVVSETRRTALTAIFEFHVVVLL